MAYGFYIKNSNGEVVIDSESPGLYLTREFNFAYNAGTTSATNKSSYYRYRITTTNDAAIVAVKLNNGDKIFGGPRIFYSNRTSINFREITSFADSAPPRSGYGLEVYAANGATLYSSARNILPVSRIISFTGWSDDTYLQNEKEFQTATVTATERWAVYGPIGMGYENTASSPTSDGRGYQMVGGIWRKSDTQISYIPGAISNKTLAGTRSAAYGLSRHSVLFFEG